MISAILGTVFFFGCAAVQPGDAIVKYEDDSAPIMTKAPSPGTYALFSSADVAPKTSVYLEKGDDLGFRRNSDGRLVAVAGKNEVPIESKSDHYWRLR
jgi:hypothetical protein